MSNLFRCCDSERIPISQSYAGIVLWVTSLLAFRTGSFEKFNFCIRSSLCQAKIYQGIPKRNKVRIKSQKVSTSFINYLLLVYSHFTTHVAYVLPPATLFFFSLCSVCLICLALFVPSLLHHTYFSYFAVSCKLFKCTFTADILKIIPSNLFLGFSFCSSQLPQKAAKWIDLSWTEAQCSSEDSWNNNNAKSLPNLKQCHSKSLIFNQIVSPPDLH